MTREVEAPVSRAILMSISLSSCTALAMAVWRNEILGGSCDVVVEVESASPTAMRSLADLLDEGATGADVLVEACLDGRCRRV